MARIYCRQCGTPLPRRATQCMQCETKVIAGEIVERQPKRFVEWVAICCAAIGCIVFVLALGITHLFRDGGWLVGGGSFVVIALSIYWIKKLESVANSSD